MVSEIQKVWVPSEKSIFQFIQLVKSPPHFTEGFHLLLLSDSPIHIAHSFFVYTAGYKEESRKLMEEYFPERREMLLPVFPYTATMRRGMARVGLGLDEFPELAEAIAAIDYSPDGSLYLKRIDDKTVHVGSFGIEHGSDPGICGILLGEIKRPNKQP